jgi:hypothetical protein
MHSHWLGIYAEVLPSVDARPGRRIDVFGEMGVESTDITVSVRPLA